MSAKAIDSFKETLMKVLDKFNPKTILEYGPGHSTMIFFIHPSVEYIRSIEHSPIWYERAKSHNLENDLVLEQSLSDYPYAIGDCKRYDLVFIDGRNRALCLDFASTISDIVILHDAERPRYLDAIQRYNYKIWTDNGSTVTLTNNHEIYDKLKEVLHENSYSPA